MKRKFAALIALVALAALAVPASSMAALAMSQPNAEFYPWGTGSSSTSSNPTIKTSYGSCPIYQIRSKTPEGWYQKNPVMPTKLTAGTCSTGASISFTGNWTMRPVSLTKMWLMGENGGLTMRFSSLPGCKLTSSTATILSGIWTNNANPGSPSTYKADSSYSLVLGWANDSPATCAKAGTRETAAVYENVGGVGYNTIISGSPGPVRIIEVAD
jgi:hypothetical protein